MVRCQLLVGMIASGKSTYARSAARQGAIIITDDALVSAVHGGDYSLYDERLKVLYKSVEEHVFAIAIALGRLVVVDRAAHLSRDGRRRWLGIAAGYDVPCEAIVFKTQSPEVHARRRFDADCRGLSLAHWQRVAAAHHSSAEPIDCSEGFARVHTITHAEVVSGKTC